MRYIYPSLIMGYLALAGLVYYTSDHAVGDTVERGLFTAGFDVIVHIQRLHYAMVFWLCCGILLNAGGMMRTWLGNLKGLSFYFGLLAAGWAWLAKTCLLQRTYLELLNDLDKIILALLVTLGCIGALIGCLLHREDKIEAMDVPQDLPF